MIWEYFVVASYKWETFWTGGVANWLAIDCDANIFVAIEYCIKVWQVVALVVL
jgi:hypothetical protein